MKKIIYLLSFVLIITTIFLSSQFSKEPVGNDPKSNLRKRISKMILEKPKQKNPKKSFKQVGTVSKKKDSVDRVITSSLRREIDKYIKQGKANIRIILNTTDDTEELSNRVESYGGEILRIRPKFMAIEIPVDRVEQLIEENDAVKYARLPFKFYPSGEITEGVELTGASIFHDTIYRGAGVKVAVLDVGFKGLTEAIAAGELPVDVITHDFSGSGLETEYYHGTACAEIVHDMAPDAELHLLKMGDEIAGYDVIDYCIENNIDIVSLSVGTFGSGPGDGTGPVDEAFDELRDAGILVVTSTGNYGNTTYETEGTVFTYGSHWEGTFNDIDGDTYHEFKNYDANSFYNVIWAYPDFNDDDEPSTHEVSIRMRWDDWPGSDIDYDMYLFEFDYETQEVGDFVSSSEDWQDGTQSPVEYISVDVPDSATEGRFYALFVGRYDESTPTGTDLEIYLGGTSEFVPFINFDGTPNVSAMATSTSSISEPADAESVMAVGAIDYTNWTTGPQEEYSSQGPTNAWNGNSARIKPDIMGPDGVTTYTKGDSSFWGTSAAAPHVAGMAALTLSMNPDMTADELQEFLEINAVDMGNFRKDNIYGHGRINATLFISSIVNSYQKIGNGEGNFTSWLYVNDFFGSSVTTIGDLDGDGVKDLAVGAYGDDDGGINKGAIYILFMNANGTVKSHQKISDTEGNFTGTLDYQDFFGCSVASISDLNGDEILDLAVGADGDNSRVGALWILFMNSDGTVKTHQKISDAEGNFTGTLNERDYFGCSVASIGDLNGDGILDLAVGAYGDAEGALWILFMNTDGTVKSHQKISDSEGNFTGYLRDNDNFSSSVSYIGDFDGDGIGDLAVGAKKDSDIDYTFATGAVWILFMNTNGTVKSYSKISNDSGDFTGELDDYDYFGSSVSYLGDLNGDGIGDLAVGADRDDDGGYDKGGVWILFLNTDGTVKFYQKISDNQSNFNGALNNGDSFGSSVAPLGDLNGDGVIDLAVGAAEDEYGGYGYGSVWIIFLDTLPFDKDHDRMLDSWERQYGLNPNTNDAIDDFDNDGLTNINEFKAGTYPNDADTDNDGMQDGWEVQYCLNPLVDDAKGDLDGDGFNNLKEYEEGTLPNDPKSKPKTGMPWLQLLLGD